MPYQSANINDKCVVQVQGGGVGGFKAVLFALNPMQGHAGERGGGWHGGSIFTNIRGPWSATVGPHVFRAGWGWGCGWG